jgi:hypothetical protein
MVTMTEVVHDRHDRCGHAHIRYARLLALGVVGVRLLAACQEDLKGGAACPSLCPVQPLQVRDTLVYPVVLDTTLVGYPALGAEPSLLLAYRGDTLQTGGVARWDSLPARVTTGSDTSKQHIVSIDTASVSVQVVDVPRHSAAVTFGVYDVDTVAADPDTAAVRTLFRPDRLVGSRTIPKDSLSNTTGAIKIPISKSFLANRVLARRRLRLGFAVRSDSSVVLHIGNATSGTAPSLSYLARAAADTQTLTVTAFTTTTQGGPPPLTNLTDYPIVLVQPPLRSNLLVVGGLPGRRIYIRLSLPAHIADSSTVIRATLLLTQAPNIGFAPTDSLQIDPRIVLASKLLDPEPGKAALVLAALNPTNPEPPLVNVAVADSGLRRIEIASVVRSWRSARDTTLTRALVLQASDEGTSAAAAYFFSSKAPVTLRPRLELSYVPPGGVGLP